MRRIYQSLVTPYDTCKRFKLQEFGAADNTSIRQESRTPSAVTILRLRLVGGARVPPPTLVLRHSHGRSAALGHLRRHSRNRRRESSLPSFSSRYSRCFIRASRRSQPFVLLCVAPSRCAISFVPYREYETSVTVARRGAAGQVRSGLCVAAVAGAGYRVPCEVFCAWVQEDRPRESFFSRTDVVAAASEGRRRRSRRIFASPGQDSSDFRGRCACLCVLCMSASRTFGVPFGRVSLLSERSHYHLLAMEKCNDSWRLKSYGMCQVYLIADTIVNLIETLSVFATRLVIVAGIRFSPAKGNFIRRHLSYFVIRYLWS